MDLQTFVAALVSAPSADNAQPWQLQVDHEMLHCSYQPNSDGPDIFGPMGHASLLSAGALQENVRRLLGQEAASTLNVSTASGTWSISIPLRDIAAADIRHKDALLSRHTNRHAYKGKLDHALPSIPQNASGRIHTVLERPRIRQLAHALRICSSARFNNHELHQWLFSSLRWDADSVARGTGLDVDTLDLPPGGRQFMRFISSWNRLSLLNRLGVHHLLAMADTRLFREAPAIIAITGGYDTQATIEAGRLMQSLWITLNEAGFAVHPYYAITDLGNRMRSGRLDAHWQREVQRADQLAHETLALRGDEAIHMLLRVGTPKVDAVRSRRQSPSAFLAS